MIKRKTKRRSSELAELDRASREIESRIHRQCEERKMFIRHELEQGKKNITVPPYDSVPLAPYVSVMWRMSSEDPDEFINRSVARYLGIESIRVAVPEP